MPFHGLDGRRRLVHRRSSIRLIFDDRVPKLAPSPTVTAGDDVSYPIAIVHKSRSTFWIGVSMWGDRRLVLAACYLTMLLIGDNSTAVRAALPAMTRDLDLGPATAEWIVNAYLLATALFIVLGGEAADRFGACRSSAAGIALFAVASLAIALAGDGVTVVGARALQGIGAALAVRHARHSVRSLLRHGPRARYRRLDGLPDAGLQHRAARWRRRDPLRRLVGNFSP
jgi:hypothetical protein